MPGGKILEKLQDFKLLPFFVLISMIAGIGVGKIYGKESGVSKSIPRS